VNNTKTISNLLILVILLISSVVLADFKTPVDPVVPDISISEGSDKKNITNNSSYGYAVILSVRDKGTFSGEIDFSADRLLVTHAVLGKVELKFTDIEKISIISWEGFIKRKNEEIFYPVKYVIKLKNGSEIIYSGKIPMLHRIFFRYNSKKMIFYSYFYVYTGNMKEKNDRKRSVPLEGTVDSVFFLKQ